VRIARHPIQPIIVAEDGLLRFKKNAIVRFLLDAGGYDLNALGRMSFSDDDREQFAQLIGYSVSGFGELSYASKRRVDLADKRASTLAFAVASAESGSPSALRNEVKKG
jgi:hypothetical protein